MQRAYADAKGLRCAAVARAWQGRSAMWGNIVGALLMQQWGTLLSARGSAFFCLSPLCAPPADAAVGPHLTAVEPTEHLRAAGSKCGSSRPDGARCVHTLGAAACPPCMRCAVLPDGAMLQACVGTAAPGARVRGHSSPRVARTVLAMPRPARTFARGPPALRFPVLCFRRPPALST